MKKIPLLIALLPSILIAQVQPIGTVIGNQTVISVPVNAPGYATAQALIYYPDDYFKVGNERKRYPLFVFLHGAGEGSSNNITEVTNQGVPYLIRYNNLKPYAIDTVTGDTVKFIVVSPHAASTGSSFSFPHMKWCIPYLDTTYRVDTSCVFVGGLSAGANGAWSTAIGFDLAPLLSDTFFTKRITGIMPTANGGYNDALQNAILRANLITTAKAGLAVLYTVGTQDPGWNPAGGQKYDSIMKAYCLPNRYYLCLVQNGTHSASVWNPPYLLSSRLWNVNHNAWDQMWSMRKSIAIVNLTANAGTPQTITLPTSTATLVGSGTTPGGTTITGYAWTRVSGPNTPGIAGAATATATLTGLIAGTYVYQLTVTNSASNTATSTVTITVNAAPPATPPTANAGSNQSLPYTAVSTILIGTGSTAASGNTLTGYLWTKISGGTVTITNTTSATATVTGLTTGSYIFSLRVTDNNGSTDTAQVLVVVAPQGAAPNVVREVAPTEYKATWLYSDGVARTFAFNNSSGHVELMPLLIGGRSAVHVSTGFNLTTILDDQGYVWINDAGKNTCKRFDTDTTGAAGNGFVSIFGYFYTYLGIRSDGTIWYAGGDDYKWYQAPGNPISPAKPIKQWIKINQPAGVVFVKLAAGNSLLGLTNTGDVYQWDKFSTSYTKVTLPKPATDITNSHTPFNIAIIPNDTSVSKMGYPYAWGSESKYWGGNGTSYSSSNPQALKTLWGMTVPIKEISANQNMIHWIDSLGVLRAIGDNVNGEAGNGRDTVITYKYPTQNAWSWSKYEGLMSTPVIIMPGTKFKKLFTGNTFSFYHYGLAVNDSLYFWGRNKSFVGGDGAVNAQEGLTPNSLDVTIPTIRTPLAVTGLMTVSYTDVPGSINPGINQVVSGSSTTLSAFATPHRLTASGKPDYGYVIVGYHWSQVSGQTTAVFGNADAQSTGVSNLQAGIPYVFRVESTDSQGGTLSSTMMVTVNGSPNPCVGCRIRKTFITTKVIKQ